MDDLDARRTTRRLAWVGIAFAALSLLSGARSALFDRDRVGRLLGVGQLLFAVIFAVVSWLAIRLSKKSIPRNGVPLASATRDGSVSAIRICRGRTISVPDRQCSAMLQTVLTELSRGPAKTTGLGCIRCRQPVATIEDEGADRSSSNAPDAVTVGQPITPRRRCVRGTRPLARTIRVPRSSVRQSVEC